MEVLFPILTISFLIFLLILNGGKLFKGFILSGRQQRELDSFFSKRISYYKKLNEKQKKRFLKGFQPIERN